MCCGQSSLGTLDSFAAFVEQWFPSCAKGHRSLGAIPNDDLTLGSILSRGSRPSHELPGIRRWGEGGRVDSPSRTRWLDVGENQGKSPTVQESGQARNCYRGRGTKPRSPARDSRLDPETGGSEGDGTMSRYMVVVERGESSWGAHVPDLPGCVAVGETRDDVLSLIRSDRVAHR